MNLIRIQKSFPRFLKLKKRIKKNIWSAIKFFSINLNYDLWIQLDFYVRGKKKVSTFVFQWLQTAFFFIRRGTIKGAV